MITGAMGQNPGSSACRLIAKCAPKLGSTVLDHRCIVRRCVPGGQQATWSQARDVWPNHGASSNDAQASRICEAITRVPSRISPENYNLSELLQPDAALCRIFG